MKLAKPSNKIFVLIIVSIIIIGFTFFHKFYRNQDDPLVMPTVVKESVDSSNSISQEINIDLMDTDGDGLADWQEVIGGTDLNNTDTDGDGTSDGKEIELNRDPRVTGPNDQKNLNQHDESLATSTTDGTISEAVSKSLFANAIYLSNNEVVTEENVANLVDNLINGVQNNFTYKEYSVENLPLITIETKENLRFFASAYASLQYALLDELAINQDMESLFEVYEKHAQTLYALPTPKMIADTQIKIINNFSKVSSVYDALAKQAKDPLKLPLAMKAYQEAGAEQENLIVTIGQYLDNNGIIETLDEKARNYWLLAITE